MKKKELKIRSETEINLKSNLEKVDAIEPNQQLSQEDIDEKLGYIDVNDFGDWLLSRKITVAFLASFEHVPYEYLVWFDSHNNPTINDLLDIDLSKECDPGTYEAINWLFDQELNKYMYSFANPAGDEEEYLMYCFWEACYRIGPRISQVIDQLRILEDLHPYMQDLILRQTRGEYWDIW